jgi:hypothetical protein
MKMAEEKIIPRLAAGLTREGETAAEIAAAMPPEFTIADVIRIEVDKAERRIIGFLQSYDEYADAAAAIKRGEHRGKR